MGARDEDVEAGGFEDFGGGDGGGGQEVVVEGVGPEEDLGERARRPLDSRRDAGATRSFPARRPAAVPMGYLLTLPPLLKRLRGKCREAAVGMDSGCQLRQIAQAGKLRRQIYQTRHVRRRSYPQIEIRQRPCVQRAAVRFVIMRQEFGFVGGYVDADGAIAFATFAGKTKIERFLDGFILPSVPDHVALGHLPKQVGAAAGGVLLFAGDAVAGAHDSAFVMATLSHSYAAQRGAGQAAVVFGKLEVSRGLPWIVAGAEAEIFVQSVGIN